MSRTFEATARVGHLVKWLLVLLFVPLAVAHGGDEHTCDTDLLAGSLSHLVVWNEALQPGASSSRLAVFEVGCPFGEGWWVSFNLEGDVTLRVDFEGEKLATWSEPGVHFVQLPSRGYPELTVTNTREVAGSFSLWFDQTCDCIGKAVPESGGAVWFNTAAGAGDEVDWSFRLTAVEARPQVQGNGPSTYTVRAMHVAPSEAGLDVLQTVERTYNQDDHCGDGPRFTVCLDATFAGGTDGVQYLWFEVTHDADPGFIVQVRPEFNVREEAPVPWFLPLLGLALVGAGKRYRCQ